MRINIYLTILIIALTAFFTSSVQAEELFKVIASKGTVQYQKGKSNKWDKVKTGLKLEKNDKIKLSDNAYLGLIYKTGQTMEVKNAGEFTVSQLSKNVSEKKSSMNSKFVQFVADQIKDADNVMTRSDYSKDMGTTGAVERSIDPNSLQRKDMIITHVPPKMNLFEPFIEFSWDKAPEAKSYQFNLRDRFDRNVYTQQVEENRLMLDINTLNLERDNYYFWNVTATNNEKMKTRDGCFLVYSDEKKQAVNDSIQEFIRDMDNGTALSRIFIAKFLEDKNLIREADNYYKEAINMAPDVDSYKNLYSVFKEKNQISN